MGDFDKPKAVDTSTSKMKVKPTAEELAIAREAYGKAKNDTQQNLSDLTKSLTPLQNGTTENEKSNKSIGSVEEGTPVPVTVPAASESSTTVAVESAPVTTDSTTASEEIPTIDAKNTMHHGNKLKEGTYKEQVRNVLNTTETDPKELKKIIKELQAKLEITQDGALGPKTFDKLKVKWDISQHTDQKPTYKEFINDLMGRPKIDVKPAQLDVILPKLDLSQPTAALTEPVTTVEGTTSNNEPKNEKSDFGAIFDSASVETEDGTAAINFELDGMVIDRDARSIIDHKDQGTYELNIGWKGENVVIDKKALNVAIKNNSETVSGETKVGKKPISIIINKEITEKTPFEYDQTGLEKGIISQGNVNYNFEFKRGDLRNFGTDPDVSSITEKDDKLSFNTKDKELMTLSKGQFEEAVKVMNKEGKNSTTVNSIIINKEKGEWKKPDAPITAGGDNSSSTTTT